MATPSAQIHPFEDKPENLAGASYAWGNHTGRTVKGSGWKQWNDQCEGKHLLIVDEEDEESAQSSSSSFLLDRTDVRRRPASAGPDGRLVSDASRPSEARKRPSSAHGAHKAPADRHAAFFRDPTAFQRLHTSLDRCPESTRLFKMLNRVESGGQHVRKKPVFRPSSAPPLNANRNSGASPYAESPAFQLQSMMLPPKQALRRPASATPANQSGSSPGHSVTNSRIARPSSALSRSIFAHSSRHDTQSVSNIRLTYIPPRPASAGPRMTSNNMISSPAFSSDSTARPGIEIAQWPQTAEGGMGNRTTNAAYHRRQRVATDLIRHLCGEAGICLGEARNGDEGETEMGTMIWRRHPSAYTRIPKHLKEKGDLMTLADMLTDTHFVVRGLICSGVEAMIAAVDTAVAAMTVAATETEQQSKGRATPTLRRLSRVRHFRVFLRLHAQTLDKEPYRFFALAVAGGMGMSGGWDCVGETGYNEETNFVTYQVERCLQEVAEVMSVIESKYVDGEGAPHTSLRRVMMLQEYLEMLLAHGCIECLSDDDSRKAHNLLSSFSKFIADHASKSKPSPHGSAVPMLGDRVRCTLLNLAAQDSPSLSESLSLAPASATRQLYLDLKLAPEVLSTLGIFSSSAAMQNLTNVLLQDAAEALGVDAQTLTIDRITSSSARLVCTHEIPAVSTASLVMDPSYSGPIVCFNNRPSAWEFVTVYLSAAPTSTALANLISDTVLLALRDLLRERCVELTIINLEDGPNHTSTRLAPQVQLPDPSHACTHSDSILLVVLPPSQEQAQARVSDAGNILFVEPAQGEQSKDECEELCLETSRELWKQLESKYPAPSHASVAQHKSVAEFAQLSEMQEMAHSFVRWPSRAEVLGRMESLVSAKLSEPVLASLAGAHGSGKSYMLAALAHQTLTDKPTVHTIYYRYASAHADRPDALASHLCWALTGIKDSRPGAEKLAAALLHKALQLNIVIIADGLDESDQMLLRSCILRPAVAALEGRVRVIYCARAPASEANVQHSKVKPAFRIQALTSAESRDQLRRLCNTLRLPLSRSMHTTVVAKKQAGVPLYLRVAAHHMALFCEYRSFQMETREKRYELLERVCHHLPGDLDYLIEDQVMTMLECRYGQELVWRILEYLYHEEGGVSVQDLTSMLAFHTKELASVSAVAVTTLCHDLIHAISSQLHMPPSGYVCMDLKSARRAVARRYFEDYVLNDREKRAVVSRCHLAQKCSDQIEATLLDVRLDDKGESEWLGQEAGSQEAGRHGAEDEDSMSITSMSMMRSQGMSGGGFSPISMPRHDFSSSSNSPTSTRRRQAAAGIFRNSSRQQPLADTTRVEPRRYADSMSESVCIVRECHTGGVLCITEAISLSGGVFVAAGGSGGEIKLLDCLCPAASAEEKFGQLRGERDSNLQDLNDLFSSGDPGLQLHLRNYCLEPHVRVRLSGHRGAVLSLAAGNGMLYSGSADMTIRVWCLESFKCVGTLMGHRSVVSSLQLSHANLYSAGHDGKIRAWNVDSKTCWASIDSTKRAAIHAITAKSDRLFVGLERRWDEIMNPIKVWDMELGACLDELPSQEIQKLARDSEFGDKALAELEKQITQLSIQSRKTFSPLRSTELANALQQAAEKKDRRHSQVAILKERFLQHKGNIYPIDDVYCMHSVTCQLGPREKIEVLFVAGNGKDIIAWDLGNMMCIEAMDGALHEADYTRCFAAYNGFLYSGGGKLTHQEKMAASSVAAKLKLTEQHSALLQHSQDAGLADDDKCGRVTVWCTSTLKPLGSMTFDNVVMSLSVVRDKLFVGEVSGSISIFAHQSSLDEFHMQIAAQVTQSVSANAMLTSRFLERREKLQSPKSMMALSIALEANRHDPALVTGLLIELGKVLAKDGAFESKEMQREAVDYVFDVIARYPTLPRLQVNAFNILSLAICVTGLSHVVHHQRLDVVSFVLRNEMKHVEVVQRAGCLLYLEMLSPLQAAPEPTHVYDPTFDLNAPSIPDGKSLAPGIACPMSATCPARVQSNNSVSSVSPCIRDKLYKDLNDARRLQLEDLASVIKAGGLLSSLSAISSYGRPGCSVDSQGVADTAVIETAVPLLRFMAVQHPHLCREIVAHESSAALDSLEARLLDDKQRLEKALLLRDNTPVHSLIADLAVAQSSMGITIRGRPVPKPVALLSPSSDLLRGLFTQGSQAENVTYKTVMNRRADSEVWSGILKASVRLDLR